MTTSNKPIESPGPVREADKISARNLLYAAVCNAAAHSNRGRQLAFELKRISKSGTPGVAVKDEPALFRCAKNYGIPTGGRPACEVAAELSDVLLAEFSSQENPPLTLNLAPQKRRKIWETKDILPFGIDRTYTEALHMASEHSAHSCEDLLSCAFRTSLSDGWCGSKIASQISGILFGTLESVRSSSESHVPSDSKPFRLGLSVDAVKYMLGGTYRASLRPLNDAIIQNRIPGVAGLIACGTEQKDNDYTPALTRELIKRDVLVLQTGLSEAHAENDGAAVPESFISDAGDGLAEICEAFGIPPILEMGTLGDSSRILEAASEILSEGGLGDDISALPLACVISCINEKNISAGFFLVASGIDVILGSPFDVSASGNLKNYLYGGAKEDYGASFHFEEDPLKAADRVIELLNVKRGALGIDKKSERKLFDMKDRRDSE